MCITHTKRPLCSHGLAGPGKHEQTFFRPFKLQQLHSPLQARPSLAFNPAPLCPLAPHPSAWKCSLSLLLLSSSPPPLLQPCSPSSFPSSYPPLRSQLYLSHHYIIWYSHVIQSCVKLKTVYTHAHTHTCTHTNAHTYTHAQTHMHINTQTDAHACINTPEETSSGWGAGSLAPNVIMCNRRG